MGQSDSCQPRDESSLLGQRVGAFLRALDVVADSINLRDTNNIMQALDVFNERAGTLVDIVNTAGREFARDELLAGTVDDGSM